MEKTEAFKNLINLIEDEIKLYESLKGLFEIKRQVLIQNDVEGLLEADDKILTKVEEIKSSVNLRQTLAKFIGKSNLNMSGMIELAKDIDSNEVERLEQLQLKINELTAEVARQERTIKELLHHGMNMVSKTLSLVTNAVSISGDYTRSGKNTQNPISQISSVVEEV